MTGSTGSDAVISKSGLNNFANSIFMTGLFGRSNNSENGLLVIVIISVVLRGAFSFLYNLYDCRPSILVE